MKNGIIVEHLKFVIYVELHSLADGHLLGHLTSLANGTLAKSTGTNGASLLLKDLPELQGLI